MAVKHSTVDSGIAKADRRKSRHEIRPLIDNRDGTHAVPTNRPDVFALIDSEFAEIIGKHNWRATRSLNGVDWYVSTRPGTGKRRKEIWIHHVIHGRSISGLETDHINRDPLDNRKCNLRHVTHRENCFNRGGSQNSVPDGLWLHKSTGKYFGKLMGVILGFCDTPEEAGRLFDAAREIIGLDPLQGHHLRLGLDDYYRAGDKLRDGGVFSFS